MLKFYDYIYINFYLLFRRISKTDSTNVGKPIILMSIIVMTNMMVLCMVTHTFNSVFFNKFVVIGFCLLLIVIHYFLFIWEKRYLEIEKQFEGLTKKERLTGTALVIFLWIEGFAIIPIYALVQ